MIANYKVQAELSAIASTKDGKALVLGAVDGCISVLALADPSKPEMINFLSSLPSRDEKVNIFFLSYIQKLYVCFVSCSGKKTVRSSPKKLRKITLRSNKNSMLETLNP